MGKCLNCNNIPRRKIYQYCSVKCQQDYKYHTYIEQWKQGLVEGTKGINTKSLSKHVERYLKIKFGQQCVICSWNVIHSVTGRVPLEADHIDGNSGNNKEENLRLICPNCHSLTANFRNLNKGRGRTWRLASSKH